MDDTPTPTAQDEDPERVKMLLVSLAASCALDEPMVGTIVLNSALSDLCAWGWLIHDDEAPGHVRIPAAGVLSAGAQQP